jgi:L-fuculose-phosphate aldolase
MDNYQTEKQQLVDAILMLERAEVIDFNGHFSWRIPGRDHMLINSGKSVRSALSASDIVTINFDGNLIEGDAVPPMEFPIHAEIYRRRADVNSVVHSHPLWSTLFSMTGRAVEPVIMQAAVLGEIRQFGKTASINRKPLAEEMADALGPHRIIMLKSHGAVVAAEGILSIWQAGSASRWCCRPNRSRRSAVICGSRTCCARYGTITRPSCIASGPRVHDRAHSYLSADGFPRQRQDHVAQALAATTAVAERGADRQRDRRGRPRSHNARLRERSICAARRCMRMLHRLARFA